MVSPKYKCHKRIKSIFSQYHIGACTKTGRNRARLVKGSDLNALCLGGPFQDDDEYAICDKFKKTLNRGTIKKPEPPSIPLPPTQTVPSLPAAINPAKKMSTPAAERQGKREVAKFCHQIQEQLKVLQEENSQLRFIIKEMQKEEKIKNKKENEKKEEECILEPLRKKHKVDESITVPPLPQFISPSPNACKRQCSSNQYINDTPSDDHKLSNPQYEIQSTLQPPPVVSTTAAPSTNDQSRIKTKTVAIQCNQSSFHQTDSDRVIVTHPLSDKVSGVQQIDTSLPQTTIPTTTTKEHQQPVPTQSTYTEHSDTSDITDGDDKEEILPLHHAAPDSTLPINPLSNIALNSLGLLNKWQSPEALLLFTGKVKNSKRKRKSKKKKQQLFHDEEDDIDVREHVIEKLHILRNAYLTSEGWKDVVDDNDSCNHCTPYEAFVIRQKALYLFVLMECALEYYEEITWREICSEALRIVSESNEITSTTTNTSLMSWFREFRSTNTFPNPSSARLGRSKIPLLLRNNPDLHDAFSNYVRQNLDSLSTNGIHQFLFDKALPEIIKKSMKIKKTVKRTCV